jgi:hypothetical protein
MTDDDLVAALRLALARAGDTWRNQPSVLRRRLEGVLGADAVSQRAKVHLLTVAAEERIPERITRSDRSSAQLASIADDLAATRGWTTAAAGWSVATWSAALAPAEVATPAVVEPAEVTSLPDPAVSVVESTSGPIPLAARAPSEEAATILPAGPPTPPLSPPPPPSGATPTPVAPATGVPGPPNRRQRKLSATVSNFLDQPIDHAVEGYRGNPKVIGMVIVGLVVGGIVTIAGIFASSTPIAGVGVAVITVSSIALPMARKAASVCWIAVQGDTIQVIETVRNANNSLVPTGVSFRGTRGDIAQVAGTSSALQIGPSKITFVRSKASAMAILGGDRP